MVEFTLVKLQAYGLKTNSTSKQTIPQILPGINLEYASCLKLKKSMLYQWFFKVVVLQCSAGNFTKGEVYVRHC